MANRLDGTVLLWHLYAKRRDMRYCTSCGTSVYEGQSFCGDCGIDLSAQREEPPTQSAGTGPQPPTTHRTGSPWGGAVVMIIGVIIAVVVSANAASQGSRGGVEAGVIVGYAFAIVGFFSALMGLVDYARRPHPPRDTAVPLVRMTAGANRSPVSESQQPPPRDPSPA